MSEPYWLQTSLIWKVHARQIEMHGGAVGIRDVGRLEAAMDRPRNLFSYEQPDLFRLAASYAHGIATGHPFVDGNKRTSLLACMIFLDRNAVAIEADDDDIYRVWIAVASGEMSELELAGWLRAHGRKTPSQP